MKKESRFVCPVSGEKLYFEDDRLCSDSGASYPVVDGIPVLLRDPEEHFERIAQFKASIKGSWYSQAQVDYYDRGPYRHSLQRRKKVVQSWVGDCCRELLGHEPGRTLTALDHGCGDGASSRWLAGALPEGSKMLLTDYNFERIVRARSLLGTSDKEYFLSQVTRPPLPAGSVDLVFSNHVIEHVLEDQELLNAIQKILRPGGFLLLGCPNSGVFFWMLAYALSPSTIRKSDHIHFYNSRVLIDMGRAAALEHLRTRYTGYGFPHYKVDLAIRRFKIINNLFDTVGRVLFPGQASSLYLLFRKG